MAAEPMIGGTRHAREFESVNGGLCLHEVAPRLHLHEGDDITASRNDVDLTAVCGVIARANAPSFYDEEGKCQPLTASPLS